MIIHSPMDGPFEFGAIMNKESMNICVKLFVRMYVFISLEMELLVHMENICLN